MTQVLKNNERVERNSDNQSISIIATSGAREKIRPEVTKLSNGKITTGFRLKGEDKRLLLGQENMEGIR
jgi:hypothetical protein